MLKNNARNNITEVSKASQLGLNQSIRGLVQFVGAGQNQVWEQTSFKRRNTIAILLGLEFGVSQITSQVSTQLIQSKSYKNIQFYYFE